MLTDAVITLEAQSEARVAFALVGTNGVGAGAVVADVGLPLTLVNVDAGRSVGREDVAGLAHTLEAALEVVALSVPADVLSLHTLINVCKCIGSQNSWTF